MEENVVPDHEQLLLCLKKLKKVFDVCDEDADGYISVEHFVDLGLQFGQGDEMICDASNLTTNVEARWPGSVHDARMYRESNLSTKFLQREFHGYLLGDRGYPCLPTLITPYPDPDAGAQTRFNVAHSRTRIKVEMTFGILKERFQCLRGLRVKPERACNIIMACAILHNIATLRNEGTPFIEEPIPEEPLYQDDMRDGQRVRDQICHNHFN